MRYRKYVVVIASAWLLILIWSGYLLLENRRMAIAREEQTHNMVARGLEVFANNCVVCHGPIGEGIVGPPLNRDEFRGDPDEETDVYDFLYTTIDQGRPGTSETRWARLETGEWASFTAMPAWGQANGGPLNEQEVRAVTTFIMLGDWTEVVSHLPPARLEGELPDAQVPDEVNQQAKEIIQVKGCLACHTIGQVGGYQGPDLTKAGTWGLDEAFLKQWISDPVGTEHRAPVYWSNYADPDSVPANPPIPLGPTQMPQLAFTDEELDVVVQYLLGLK